MAQFGANYETMQTIARETHEAAKRYVDSIDAIYKLVDRTSEIWEGTDNYQFIDSALEYKETMNKLGQVINNYAVFLDKAAVSTARTQEAVRNLMERM